MKSKREYVAKIKLQFPLIDISEEDIANCNLIELKKRVYQCLENVRMTSSAIVLQRAWRRKIKQLKQAGIMMKQTFAAKTVQKAWREYYYSRLAARKSVMDE